MFMQEAWRLYCYENDDINIPERVLVYRDGMSDGNFSQADNEIGIVRKVLSEVDSREILLPISKHVFNLSRYFSVQKSFLPNANGD